MLRKGMDPADFAEYLGVSRSRLGNWLSARNGTSRLELQKISEKTGYSVGFLKGNEDQITVEAPQRTPQTTPTPMPRNGYGPYYGTSKEAPVVSMAQAGSEWHSFEDLFGQSGETFPTSCRDENGFWLRITGDSMSPRYEPGDLVMVMPNVEPRNGDLVVVKTKEGSVHFKIFHWSIDNLKLRLTSYNSLYPEMMFERERIDWVYPVHSVLRIIRY